MMESEKSSAMGSGKATEVRSLIQVELDKLDTLRKKYIHYFALKQQKALERFKREFENKLSGEVSRVENKSGGRKLKVNIKPGEVCDDWDCDCEGHDEVDS